MSYLSDFKEFDEGYVTFGEGAKGGRFTGKGTLKTANKDKTTGILKKFIKEIENLVDKKVKAEVVNTACYVQNKAEVVNTACYVQNKVLVVKPYDKTPYELFRDHLGKFDGKFDDGFIIGYSLNMAAGTNSNDFVGTEESIFEGHSSKENESSQDYILMPLWKDGSLFDSSLMNTSNVEPQPSSDDGKKDDEGVSKESGTDDQERPKNSI
nr:hypothetical protein [Tanacetum cinerariifolium]